MRYPVQLQIKREGGTLAVKAATSVELVAREARNPDQELRGIEIDCAIALATAQAAMTQPDRRNRRDPRAYWFAAKALSDFLDRLRQASFYLVHQNATFANALGCSEVSIRKLLAFYRRFPDIRLVDLSIPWAKYRDNEVRRKVELSSR